MGVRGAYVLVENALCALVGPITNYNNRLPFAVRSPSATRLTSQLLVNFTVYTAATPVFNVVTYANVF